MKIQIKLVIILIVFILVTGTVATLVSRSISKEITQEQVYHHLEATAQSRADHVETVLNGYKELTKTLAAGNAFGDAVDESKEHTWRMEQSNCRIKSIIHAHDEISMIKVLDANGIVVASNRDEVGLDKSTKDSFMNGKDGVYIKDPHISLCTGNTVISISTPILLDGEFSGVLVINFDAGKELFVITTDRTGLGDTGEIYLVNRDGYMITPAMFANGTFLKQRVNVGHISADGDSVVLTRNYQGTDVLRFHTYLPEMEWSLIAEMSEKEAFAPVARLSATMLFVIIALLLAGVFVSIFVTGTISKPISDLHRGLREVRGGNLDYEINIKTGDEIELFADEFNLLSAELSESRLNFEEKVDERTKELSEAIERSETETIERMAAEERLAAKREMDAAYTDILTALGKSIDLNVVLTGGLSLLMKYTSAPLGVIYMYDAKNKLLVPAVTRCTDDVVSVRKFSSGEGIPGQTALEKKMVVVTDIPEDTIYGLEAGLCEVTPGTIVSAPMIFNEMLLGVIVTGHVGAVTPDVLGFIKRVVYQLAVAVHNAQSYIQTQEMAAKLKNQRDELEMTSRELAAASKTKSEFLANMSHELRTPLNSIIGFSEILHDETFGALNEKQSKYAKNILTSGKHLLHLINNILDLSKVEAGKVELEYVDFDVLAVLEEVKTLVLSIAAKKRIRIAVTVNPELTTINGDVSKFKQILYNLLSNAIKFTPDGGSITVDGQRRGEMAQISVTDTGIGISQDAAKKLFQPFVQADSSTSRKYGGTGLGLTLVKRFVELQGGKIWIESEPDRGSTFIFTMPVAGKAEARTPETSATPGTPETAKTPVIRETREMLEMLDTLSVSAPGDAVAARDVSETGATGDARKGGKTGGVEETWIPAITEPAGASEDGPLVLVVEDDRDASELLTVTLNDAGYRVVHAYNGKDALAIAQKLDLAAITLDILLPGMDGWSVLKYLKYNPETSAIPVIVVSMVDEKTLGFSLGAVDYLSKPVDKDALLGTLGSLKGVLEVVVPKVLVVDDEPDAVEMIASMIEPAGFDVLRAYGGQEGLDIAFSEHPDILVLDLMMPVVSGFEVLSRLRDNPATKNIPVIICTAKDVTDDDVKQLSNGVISILQKGAFSGSGLVEKIMKVTAKRRDKRR
jgi:signal transduction histidine kinase/CheY-like chemotaxis protein/HAMP domain-containing protein